MDLQRKIFLFIMSSGISILSLMEEYQVILFVLIFTAFAFFVMRNEKYKYLADSIDKYFGYIRIKG